MNKVPVLIVGGGPVGLTTSILLSKYGIGSLLVERHPGTSLHPKARLVSIRSMEIFRQCALESAIRGAGVLPGDSPVLAWGRSLSDPQLKLQSIMTLAPEEDRRMSPTAGCGCPQDVLESVLLKRARDNPAADLRFGHELLELQETDCGVTAAIRERSSDNVIRVQAQFVVGADGAHSTVRDILGIEMIGPKAVSQALSILFRADLTAYVCVIVQFFCAWSIAPRLRGCWRGQEQRTLVLQRPFPGGCAPRRFLNGPCSGTRSHRARRMRTTRPNRVDCTLRQLGQGGTVLRIRSSVPCRRCRARDDAGRRARHEYRHPRRTQSRVEARGGAPH